MNNVEKLNYRIKELVIVLSISNSTIWRRVKESKRLIQKAKDNGEEIPDNLFPIPHNELGPKITAWHSKEIHQWNEKMGN